MTAKNRMSRAIFMIVAFSLCWTTKLFANKLSVASETEFVTAIGTAGVDSISITKDFNLTRNIDVNKSLTILGNGHTITRTYSAGGFFTDPSYYRILFSANTNIKDLVFDGNELSSASTSFLLVNANVKVTMDQNTIIKNSSNGNVIIVNGTLVGGVITGNRASSSAIVTVPTGGKVVNTLMYENSVTGRTGNLAYVVNLTGGQLINATVVKNSMSGGNSSTTRSYAVSSSNTNSRVANCIVTLNTNSQATTVNCNLDMTSNHLTNAQIKNTYSGTADPGFVDAANNDFTLTSSSACLDKGDDSYVTEKYDLAGMDRISGRAVDQGAFEFQSCALITASKSEDLIIGERVVLEVKSVNSEYANVAYEFQWQSSRDGSTWSNIGRNANEARYIIDQVSDSIPYYRVNLVKKGGTREVLCTARAPKLNFADPYVRFVITGYDRVVTHYAYEVPFENKITFGLEAINHATITAFNLEESKLERGKIRDLDASNVFDYKYTLTVDDAYAYKLSYAYRIGTTPVKKDTSFIIRPIYKCTGKSNQLIFKDDFGTFDKTANGGNGSYTYVDSVNISHTITRYTQSDRTQRNIKSGNGTTQYGATYAVPDFQNAVVGHNYSGTNGFAVNDGYYTISPTTHDAWSGHEGYFGNYPDHTAGDGKGGMLGVNCRENSKDTRIYQRDFSVECDSSLVIFSSYVANFNAVDYSDYSTTRRDPLINANVRLDIFELDEDKEERLIGVAYSGDLLSREHDYDNVPGVDSYWSNLSAKFLANSGVTYRIALTNNRNGGSGNDMLFDDISITACCPDMAISDNPSFVNENQNVEICGSDSSTFSIYAIMRDGTVADDYFVSPYYYLYQYREKGSNQWNNLIEGGNPYVSEHKYTIDLNTFPSGSECRVILARSTQRIQQILNHYNGTLTDASLTEEQRYPPVDCKEGIYGVAYGYSISYYPELATLGDDKVRVACPGEKFTFSYDPGDVWKQRTWLDADKKALTSDNSTSYSATKSSNEIDTYYYVVAGEGGACPDTVSFEAHLNHSLALLEVDDIVASAGDDCKANVALASYKPEYSYCAPDLKSVDYSYQVNKGAWVDYTAASKALVANGDSVTWRAILFVTGETSALDTAYYTEHVTVTDDVEPLIDCATLSQVIELPAADEIVGDVSVSVSASDIRNASSDNCTAATDLNVMWNSYSGHDMMAFGEDPENVQLNVYNNPKAEIIWQVVDEANNASAPCIATYEIKKDKFDELDGPYAVIRDTTICEGDFPFTWYGHVFEADGDTAHVGYALLKVFADSSYFETIKVTVCGSYTFRDETFFESEVVTRRFKAEGATCDSVITLDMTINPVYDITIEETACDSFTWNGVTYKESGSYSQEFNSVSGCDSIVTLNLTISKSFYDTIHVAVANQFTWSENQEIYFHSGFYQNQMKNENGCDSIYSLDLTIYPPTRGDTTIILCKKELPYKYSAKFANVLDGTEKALTKDTVITYARENMGDSIITFKMIVLEETTADFTRDVCRNEFPFEFDHARGLVVNEPHDTVFVIENSVGCDSTINLHLNILEPSPLTIVNEVACESFTYRGVTYEKDTTFIVDDLKNIAGCDSIIDVTIKINKTINTVENLGEVCDSVLWHGNWYYETNNVAQFTTQSTVTGCDSIVTLNVVVNHSVTTRDQMHLCTSQFDAEDKYTATKWGKTITLPSVVPSTVEETYETFTAKGCDSIVKLTFFIDNSIDIKDTVIAKDRYTWPVDNKEYTASGEYVVADAVKNAADCDSSARLVLHIVPTKTETVDVTNCDEYTIQFGNVAYSTKKDTSWNIKLEYDTTIVLAPGVEKAAKGDSILTLNVKINRKDTVYLPIQTICSPIIWNGNNVNRSGSYNSQSVSKVTGCDSITFASFRLRIAKEVYDTVSVCDSYTWDRNGVTYTASQDDEKHVAFKDGTCDSVVYYLHLTIKEQTSRNLNVSLSQVGLDTFSVEGHKGFVPEAIKKEDGTIEPVVLTAAESAKNSFLSIRKNAAGCDSTVNVHVTLLQSSDTTKLDAAICEADLPYTFNVSGVDYKVKGDTAVMTKNQIGGDSLVALSLKINKANSENVRINECGLSYTWNEKVYTESTLDTFKTVNAAGCDSLVYLNLTLRKPTYKVESISACDSFEWNGIMYKESRLADDASVEQTFKVALGDATGETLPYYIESKSNAAGCDSVVILDLLITKTVYGPITPVTTCDSYQWLSTDEHPDGIYTESGSYEARTTAFATNCDSVAYLDLTILKSTVLDTVLMVCENKPMVFDGKTIKGDTTFHIDNAAGCDSTINVKVQVLPTYNITETKVTCDSVVEWLGETLRESGVYTKSLKTKICDCDSIITLNLTINPSPVVNLTESACGRFELGGKYYTESGVITETFATKAGCDSIVIVDLTVLKPEFVAGDTIKTFAGDDCKSEIKLDQVKPSFSYCDPEADASYTYSKDSINWSVVTPEGTTTVENGDTIYWRVDLSDQIGKLDSIIKTQVVTVTDTTAPQFMEDCSAWVSAFKVVDTITGNVSFNLSADSIRVKMKDNCSDNASLNVQWSVNGSEFVTMTKDSLVTLNAYKGDKVEISWRVVDENGNASAVCDKSYEVERDTTGEDGEKYSIIRDTVVCSNDMPLTWHGATFNADGDTAHVGTTLLNVHINKSFFVVDTVVACDSYVWRDGITYSASNNTAVFNAANVGTCDSVYTLNLTILKSTKLDTVITVCESQLPIALGGSTIGSDSTFTLSNLAGCDSIVDVKLNVIPTKRDTAVEIACSSYEWNNMVLTESGFYSDTLTSDAGCDSISVLNLTIALPAYDTIVAKNVCHAYTMNGVDYTKSGIYNDTLQTEAGCDSIVTLDLTIAPVVYDTVPMRIYCGSLVWNGKEYSETGLYNDTLTSTVYGCDSIVTLDLVNAPSNYNIELTTCEGLPAVYKDINVTKDTVLVVPGADDCDVVYNVTLHVIPALSGDTADVVACENFLWNGITLTESGIYKDTISSSVGCDSVAILRLTIAHPDTIVVNDTIMAGESYVSAYGYTIENAAYGVHNYDTTIVSASGCEDLIKFSITAMGRAIVIDSLVISGGENGYNGSGSDNGNGEGNNGEGGQGGNGEGGNGQGGNGGNGENGSDGAKVIVNGGLWFCSGDYADIKVYATGAPSEVELTFDSLSTAAGFNPITTTLETDGSVQFFVPDTVDAGNYVAYIQLHGEGMSSQRVKVNFMVSLSGDVIKRKWNDVVVCNNSDTMFVAYQWYKNNVKIDGATAQYYNDLTGVEGTYSLDVVTVKGDTLHVCGKSFELLLPEFSITAYPVPAVADEELTIQVMGLSKDQLAHAKLVVYSVDGTIMYKDFDGLFDLNVITLPIGDYVAVVTVDNGLSASCKILVRP